MTARYTPHPDAAWRNLDGRIFVISVDSRQHELEGDVERVVWSMCDEAPRTRDELVDAIVARFDVLRASAEADLSAFLDQMVKALVFAEIS